ncbi:hypothetical protein PC129_g20963 [Phytophthora cactorum]|uniref:Uncharacterized protein n=1 Tax=Phytophthora cactorum TaxID=29920 RepID=A0A8T1CZP4_9STRA|nr:hypothetical protein Pcac1_g5921 [Phytophthora cactorum]KAG2872955.1 hypothetical protein PC114_g26099 [Phytophthora cactorum]KAG2930239.1 hypothetical protein PC117_g13760 [Phytophthora cactorum]KAG3193170.1 hypothetical protein PC128_g10260 [Phytophthora cactorum]KAG3208003.1 hypothetical protein PC129_g20963 [Phytophthora cactorum]
MTSIQETEVASTQPVVVRTADTESDVARLVREFPQDASYGAFAKELKKRCHCKRLRAACTELHLHPQADPSMNHKDGYIQLLSAYRRAKQHGITFTGYPKSKPKPQKRRGTSNEIEGRTEHCSGIPAFFTIEGSPERNTGIDPRLAVLHPPSKPCAIWKDMATKYEECYSRWKQLGTDSQRASERARTEGTPKSLTPSVNSETEGESEHADIWTPREVEVLTQRQVLSTNALQDHLQRRMNRSSGEAQVPTQRQASSQNGLPELRQRQLLPRSDAVLVSMQRQDVRTEAQEVPSRPELRVVEERVQQVLDLEPERRHVNQYEGVIYSSQAVRDTMAAIEALERGRFDIAVICTSRSKYGRSHAGLARRTGQGCAAKRMISFYLHEEIEKLFRCAAPPNLACSIANSVDPFTSAVSVY